MSNYTQYLTACENYSVTKESSGRDPYSVRNSRTGRILSRHDNYEKSISEVENLASILAARKAELADFKKEHNIS